MVLGDRIKALREKRDWSQTLLAKKIGISKSVMSRIEAGTRPLEDSLLVILADTLETSADYLLGRGSKTAYIEETEIERIIRETNDVLKTAKNVEQAQLMLDLAKNVFKK